MKKPVLLTIYSLLSILLVASITLFMCVFFLMPFPERFSIPELDKIAIDIGESKTFILLIVSGIMMGISFIINFIIGPIIFVRNYKQNSWFYYLVNKKNSYKWFCIFIIFCSSLISFIIVFIYWKNYLFVRTVNEYKNVVGINKFARLTTINLPYKSFFKKSIIFTIVLTLLVPVAPLTYFFTKEKTIYVNKTDINNFLTLSNNKENTLMLYFDRAQGMLWNSLLGYDYFVNKEKSFIALFPEFTSFTNVISQGRVTNSSNPSLVSGHFYSPWMNNINEKNPYLDNSNFNNLSIGKFWSEAFYNQFKMLTINGTSDIHISSVPYYSYNGDEYGKPNLFNESFNKIIQENSNVNFAFTTNEAIAADKLNHNKADRLSNAMVLKESKNLLNFKNTQGGVYQGWYFHHTHENYCYEEDNSWVEAKNQYLDFIKSMWFSINELKSLLLKLKNEKWSDGNVVSNVYDHTQIIIVSDHGYSLPQQSDVIDNFLSWIQNTYHTDKNFDPYNVLLSYNSIFMYKPFNGNINGKFFDTNSLILTSDVPLIIEEGLNNYNSTNFSYFSPDLSQIKNAWLKKYMQQIIIDKPIRNKNKLSQRIVRLEAADWRFNFNNKYNIIKTFDIDVRNKSYSEIFNSNIIYN